ISLEIFSGRAVDVCAVQGTDASVIDSYQPIAIDIPRVAGRRDRVTRAKNYRDVARIDDAVSVEIALRDNGYIFLVSPNEGDCGDEVFVRHRVDDIGQIDRRRGWILCQKGMLDPNLIRVCATEHK